jgi:hypothetical protein
MPLRSYRGERREGRFFRLLERNLLGRLDEFFERVLDAGGRSVALDTKALGLDVVGGDHRHAVDVFPVEALAVKVADQNGLRRHRAGGVVVPKALDDVFEHFGFERHAGLILRDSVCWLSDGKEAFTRDRDLRGATRDPGYGLGHELCVRWLSRSSLRRQLLDDQGGTRSRSRGRRLPGCALGPDDDPDRSWHAEH